ncbi:MAG: hypothetical protein ACKV2Q_19100 [Planctomycetaceae bacterium]
MFNKYTLIAVVFTTLAGLIAYGYCCQRPVPPDPEFIIRRIASAKSMTCDLRMRERFGEQKRVTLTDSEELRTLSEKLKLSRAAQRRGSGAFAAMGIIKFVLEDTSNQRLNFVLIGSRVLEFGDHPHPSPNNYVVHLASNDFFRELCRQLEPKLKVADPELVK